MENLSEIVPAGLPAKVCLLGQERAKSSRLNGFDFIVSVFDLLAHSTSRFVGYLI